MTLYASKSTQGFYDSGIHSSLPPDAVQISVELHRELLNGQASGKIIDWSGPLPVSRLPDPPSNSEVVASTWQKIKAKRDAVCVGGAKLNNYWFHSDDKSRVQYLGLKDSARDILDSGGTLEDPIRIFGQIVLWKTLSGAFVPMTVGLANQLVEAMRLLDAAAFANAEFHRAGLSSATTPASYDWSTGWPVSYEG